MSDDSKVMAFIKKQGGTISLDMCRLGQEVFDWTEQHVVFLTARFIQGKKNMLPDQSSQPDHVLPADGHFFFECSVPPTRTIAIIT